MPPVTDGTAQGIVDPPAQSDRIVTLDILRGIALFGMILVHFHQRMEIPTDGVEDLVGYAIWMGVESKSWATFAFLFGAGFAILMKKTEARGLEVVPLFLRRMLALAIFGLIVQLLLGFRVLLEYAFWGIPLLLVRNWSTRALLVLALLAAAARPAYTLLHDDRKEYAAQWRASEAAEESGTFTEAVKARATLVKSQYVTPKVFLPDSNLVLFIAGLLAIRFGVFNNPKRHKRLILAIMGFGLASWFGEWILFPKLHINTSFGIIRDQWLAFTYIGAVTLLLAYWPEWKRLLSISGIAGRMALTNYVLQAAILSVLATGYGFGVKVRPYHELPLAIVLFLILALLSAVWLSRFSAGPLERLWRRFTYYRRESVSPAADAFTAPT